MFTCQNIVLPNNIICCIKLLNKSGNQTLKNQAVEHSRISNQSKNKSSQNEHESSQNTNFAMKHNPQNYLNNNKHNNLKSEMYMLKPSG